MQGVADVCVVSRRVAARDVGGADPLPRLARVGEQPTVARVAARVDCGDTDRAVVGMIDRAAVTPREVEVRGHDDVGTQPPVRGREVARQREAVLDRAVGVAQELHFRHADDRRALPFLGLAQRARLGRRHAVDARLAARREDVRHLLALARPARDRARDAVLAVVGVRDDGHRTLPVLCYGVHAVLRSLPATRSYDRGPVPHYPTGVARPRSSKVKCADSCRVSGRRAPPRARRDALRSRTRSRGVRVRAPSRGRRRAGRRRPRRTARPSLECPAASR